MALLSAYLGTFGVGTCSRGDQPWEFHTFIDQKDVDPEHSGRMVLQLPEVLAQVFTFVESSTLCTTVPLVCKQWCNAARTTLLWTPRIDPQLLSIAQQLAGQKGYQSQHTTQQSKIYSCPTVTGVNLALLHRAVYSRNLLRNPCFVSTHNFSRSSSGAGGASPKRAVISSDQRRLAWVTTVGEPNSSMWQSPPAGLRSGAPAPPAPLPYPVYPSSMGLSGQLQGWWKGLSAGALGRSAAGSSGSSNATEGELSCLATGSNWGEVVQVVDLVEELVLRGLSEQLATAVLDHAGLALGLSVWVAAPEQQQLLVAPWEAAATTTAAVEAAAGAASSPSAHAQFAAALMLDDGQVPLKSFQTFVKRDSSHHFFSKRLAVAPGGWRRYAYLLPCIPSGCRRAVVLLRGRGPYPAQQQRNSTGVKFASAQLAFVLQSEIDAFGAEACLSSWADKQVTGL